MGGEGGSVMVRVPGIHHTGTAMARHVHLALVLVAARDVHLTVRRGMRIGSEGIVRVVVNRSSLLVVDASLQRRSNHGREHNSAQHVIVVFR